ncbi:hypothetical protein [Arthrobacter sp. ISL-69]|uniref:hypothetical protein n=1 Tax=Arthrobacter sp. ISL-69 TaxID=2819113 RepID=UPI001BE507B9|nr:hypothetical protein [Arthrobacter sp. ISL-69]MBT2537216.1 hypothetical protein [Arthrobacter sp. ISL-69]
MSEPTPEESAIYLTLRKTKYTAPADAYILAEYAKAVDAAFVVIPRDELPEVEEFNPDEYRVDGQHIVFKNAKNARAWVMQDVALWQYLEAKETESKAVSAQRAKRRHELARDLAGEGFSSTTYDSVSAVAKNAIDRIIELEGVK